MEFIKIVSAVKIYHADFKAQVVTQNVLEKFNAFISFMPFFY